MRLVGGAHSDVGQVRSNNQDAALADPAASIYAVADGMGGHRGGEVASAMALTTLSQQLRSLGATDAPLVSAETLVDAVLGANDRVFEEAAGNAELFGMGTTLCAVALVGDAGSEQVAVVNVGDSRVYLLHDGELSQLTEDHSLVQGLVRDGQLTADEAAVHPQRNILTRVIGVEPDVEVDWWEWPAVVGDRYLLCSDGLFNEVTDARIAATLRQLADPQEAARTLVSMANAGGGRDNVTCVVVDVVADEPGGPVPPPADPGPTAGHALAVDLAAAEQPEPPPQPRPRRFTFRVVAFVVVLIALAASAVIAIRSWSRHNYFVAVAGGNVVIYRGRPDGVLWFDPELVDTTDVRVAQLTPAQLQQVNDGYRTASLGEALRWVTLLTTPTTTTPPQTTTTTTPPPTASTSSSPVAPAGPAGTAPITVAGADDGGAPTVPSTTLAAVVIAGAASGADAGSTTSGPTG